MAAQPDDFFIPNRMWDPLRHDLGDQVYRMSDEDWMETLWWQREVRQSVRNAADFRIEWPYNGRGGNVARPAADPLTDIVKQQQDEFLWVSHTFDHLNLDPLTCDETLYQVRANDETARRLGLTHVLPTAIVTPEVSGLDNADAMRGLARAGVRFVVGDTTKADQVAPSPNSGNRSRHQPSVLLVPRHATNLYYNASTPREQVAEFNHLKRDQFGFDVNSFAQIAAFESDRIVWQHLLRFDMSPFMFHQSNLRSWEDEDGQRGQLMPLLLDDVFARYNEVYDLPIITLPLHEIGLRMLRRMECEAADQSASLTRGDDGRVVLVLQADRPCAMAVTGLASGTFELYGGQPIAYIPLQPGHPATISLAAS